MIAARLLDPRSKLATARALHPDTLSSSLSSYLGLQATSDDDLYRAMGTGGILRQPLYDHGKCDGVEYAGQPATSRSGDTGGEDSRRCGFENPYFDPLAFASANQPRYGSAGFNSLRGPGVINLDLSVFREFRMTERFRVQFRAEDSM